MRSTPPNGAGTARRSGRPHPAGFPPSLSRKAAHALEELGVTPLAGHTVVDVAEGSVAIQTPDGEVEQVAARTAIWAAGVNASQLAAELASAAGLDLDRAGRVTGAART